MDGPTSVQMKPVGDHAHAFSFLSVRKVQMDMSRFSLLVQAFPDRPQRAVCRRKSAVDVLIQVLPQRHVLGRIECIRHSCMLHAMRCQQSSRPRVASRSVCLHEHHVPQNLDCSHRFHPGPTTVRHVSFAITPINQSSLESKLSIQTGRRSGIVSVVSRSSAQLQVVVIHRISSSTYQSSVP